MGDDSASDAGGPPIQRVATGQSITKVGEFGYPSGHLKHLTAEQEAALTEFKQLAAEDGSYKTAASDKPASHDDVTMLRFLRARRFVPKDALGQFRDTEVWREQNHITDLYDNIDVEDYEETRRLYPQWTGRRDKRGIPVYCFEVAPLNSKTMSEYLKSSETTKVLNVPLGDKKKKSHDTTNVPPRLLRLFALYENLITFTMPLCTKLTDRPHSETPISQSNNIVDISKVGLKQFWNLRSHMQDASQLATAHYPETLDRIFIVGAPGFFPTVWSWIKRWFDPITVSKIFILTESSAYQTLSSFIDPENIPKKYGGKLEWGWGDKPVLDPEEAAHLKFAPGYGSEKAPDGASNVSKTSWPQGPLRWAPKDGLSPDGGDVWDLVAVGSVNGKERREVIGSLNWSELALSRAASRQTSRPTTSGEKSSTEVNNTAAAAAAAAATAGVAGLTVTDKEKTTAVEEPAPIPPEPQATSEVPFKSTVAELPPPTSAEAEKPVSADAGKA